MRWWKGMFACSSSADTPSAAQVTIGASKDAEGLYVQTLSADSKSHIAGPNYPMYGDQSEVSKSSNPRVQMKHLSALVALKVVNQGDGIQDNGDESIIVRELTFSVPKVVSKQAELPIIGAFTVNTTGSKVTASNFTPVTGSSSSTVTLKLTESVTIPAGDEATFYIAVRPFNASTINPNNTDPTLEVSINGSKRQVSIPAIKANFEPGKITTLRVPVKLSYPKASDALGTQPAGYEFITWENMRSAELNVNGEKVNAYIVGEGGKAGKIIIEGTARDLINGMDVGFYASTWSGKKSAMTVSRINLWMPEYNSDGTIKKHTQIASYGPLQKAVEEIAIDVLGVLGWLGWNTIGKPAFAYMLQDGIPKVKEKDTDLLTLTQFMDAANITFSNVIENSALEGATSLIMLDENPIYKELGSAAVAKLLEEKFDHKDENNNIIIPTYEGLYDIVNGVESTEADVTANAIFGKLKSTIGSKTVSLMSSLTINVWDIFSAIFPDAATMKRIMGDLKVRVYISTCPYGTDTAYNPMIFWGLDAYGPDRSAPLVAE